MMIRGCIFCILLALLETWIAQKLKHDVWVFSYFVIIQLEKYSIKLARAKSLQLVGTVCHVFILKENLIMYVKAIWGHKWVPKYACIYSVYKFSVNTF